MRYAMKRKVSVNEQGFACAVTLRQQLARKMLNFEDRTPSQLAHETLYINSGSDTIKFNLDDVPYMREPLDCLVNRQYKGVVVAASARSGKSKAIIEGCVNFIVRVSRGDTLLVFSTKSKAEDYSKKDLFRCFTKTKEINSLLSTKKVDNNIKYFRFLNDVCITLDSANPSSLSASTYKYVLFTDYDRASDEVGDEGSKFSLGLKRIQTSGSSAKVYAESSPSRSVSKEEAMTDGHYMAAPHQNGGIAALYNRTDRRVFYYHCDACSRWFAPRLENLSYSVDEHHHPYNITLRCPCCNHAFNEDEKRRLNANGRYFKDGEIIQGERRGDGARATLAGFHFSGVVAAFQTWHEYLSKYLQAQKIKDELGDDAPLKSFYNVEEGVNFIIDDDFESTSSHDLLEIAHTYERGVIPNDGRILVAAVDVQGGKTARFIVQMMVFGENCAKWIIDRFEISTNEHGDRVQPESRLEDWLLLEEQVLKRTYPVNDDTGRTMRPFLCLIDSGGSASKRFTGRQKSISTTSNAYLFYWEMKKRGLAHLVQLVKGGSVDFDDYTKDSKPQKSKTGEKAPQLLILNSNRLKNLVAASFSKSSDDDFNYTHFPLWTTETNPDNPTWWFDELTAESRDAQGQWHCPEKTRNESFDLSVYAMAGAAKYRWIDQAFWLNPPSYAQPWETNSYVALTHEFKKERRKGRKIL